MRTRLLTICLLGLLVTTGCRLGRRAPYADDPTLLYYKPTLNDSSTVLAQRARWREPVKPAMPAVAQNSQPMPPMDPTPGSSSDSQVVPAAARAIKPLPPIGGARPPANHSPSEVQLAVKTDRAEIGPLPNESSATAAKLPATDVTPLPNPKGSGITMTSDADSPQQPPAIAASREATGKYGHLSDYHWIQGVLEKHYRGYFCVRYADASEEDRYGGKVRLADDPRLAQYRDGDVLGI